MHRYITVGGSLFRLSEANRRRALEAARHMNATDIALDPDEFGMVEVSTKPVEDWTYMTSTIAYALLLASPSSETADESSALIDVAAVSEGEILD